MDRSIYTLLFVLVVVLTFNSNFSSFVGTVDLIDELLSTDGKRLKIMA